MRKTRRSISILLLICMLVTMVPLQVSADTTIGDGGEIDMTPTHTKHTAGSVWLYDETSHWHQCTGCEETLDTAAHTGGTATCADLAVCAVCGAAYGTTDSNQHIDKTELRNEKKATEFEPGYTGDLYCLGCGELIALGEPIPVIHEHDYAPEITPPSCTEQGYTTYTCRCGDWYVDDFVDATGHDYQNGVCVNCGDVVEVITYTYGQSAQIKLIEPWGLKANAKISTAEGVIDYNQLYDYGVYFIRGSELDTVGLTQANITAEDILSDADAVQMTKADGVTVSGAYLTAIYEKDIYTYELTDSIFVMFYFVTEEGADPIYVPIRERNLEKLVAQRKDDQAGFPNVLERNVYALMEQLEEDVADYRSDFASLSTPEKQKAPTLAQYPLGAQMVDNKYSYGQNAQIKLIEPWGLKANVKVSFEGQVVDYNSVEEFGIVALADNSREYTDAAEILQNENAYVFSSKNGDAAISNGYISATYSKGIYTYQLNTDIYVFGYVKDADGYHYGPVRNRNVFNLMDARKEDVANFPNVKERIVYADMINLYNAITAYREDYFNN